VGWAGPAQLTGLDSALKKGWADLGPIKSPIFVWAIPGPDSRDGPESVWPREEKKRQCWARISLAQQHNIRGGIISPPPLLHAERCSFCMQGRKKPRKCKQLGGRKVTSRGGDGALLVWLLRWRCCGGGRWRFCGSRAAAPNSNVTASGGGKKRLLFFPSPPFSSSSSAAFPFPFGLLCIFTVFSFPFL